MDCEAGDASQTTAVQCDSCGSLSTEAEKEDRLETPTVNGMPPVAGSRWCVDCRQTLCTDCVVIHSRLTASRSHCVVALPLRGREFLARPCPTHVNLVSEMFCWQCRALVCVSCATSPQHRDHSCDDVVSSAARLRSLLADDAAAVDQRRRRCDQLEAEVAAERDSWLGSVQTADSEIRAAADQLRALVDGRCAELREELAVMKQTRLKQLQRRLDDVTEERGRLSSLQRIIHEVVDAAADTRLLLDAGRLHESAQRCVADASRWSLGSGRTVLFVPSCAPAWSSDDQLLGRFEVVGGEVSKVDERRPTAAVQTKSSDWTGRPHHQASSLSYRQLLATLSDSRLPVCGLALVADRLYVCRSRSPDIDVYDAARTTYRRQRSVHVPGLSGPSDMAGAVVDDARLFVSSESDGLVFRVDADVVVASWSTDDRPYGVSPLGSAHLLVLSRQAASVTVLDHDGRALRRLRLPASVASPWSALAASPGDHTAAGHLLVCHGLDVSGRERRCVSRLDWSTGGVTQRHDWLHRPRHAGRPSSMHMAAEWDAGGFLLSDQCCDVVQRLDSGLTSHQSLLQTSADDDDDDDDDSAAARQPCRLCVDSTRQRLIVGLDDGRVKVFANGCVVM